MKTISAQSPVIGSNSRAKLFTVSYSWTADTNELTESQILGNGCVDHETGRLSDFGRAVQSARVGQTVKRPSAFQQWSAFVRVA